MKFEVHMANKRKSLVGSNCVLILMIVMHSARHFIKF